MLLVLLLTTGASTSEAFADEGTPTVRTAAQDARAWLAGQQRPDGAFGSQSPWRDSHLALEALGGLDQAASDRLASWVATSPPNNDFLARRIIVSARLGSDTTSDTARLLASQQPDGGFPLSSSGQSDVLDTVLALRAMLITSVSAAQQREAAKYLIAEAGADGGWSFVSGGPSDTGLTAEVLTALVYYSDSDSPLPGLSESIQAARQLLLSTRSGDGGWGSFANSARAYSALVEAKAQFDESATVNWIVERQLQDGSFAGGGVRETALAIGALDRADRNVAVSAMTVSDAAPSQGGVVQVTVTLANDGYRDIVGLPVRISAVTGGVSTELATQEIAYLSAGDSTTVSYNYDTCDASGTVEFEATADPDGALYETDETDNRASTTITIRTPLLAPTPLSPDDGSLLGIANPVLAWASSPSTAPGSQRYVVQLDRSASFSSSFCRTLDASFGLGGLVTCEVPADVHLADGSWYWRVRAIEGDAESPWSVARALKVDRTPPALSGMKSGSSLFSPNADGVRDNSRLTFQLSEPATGSVSALSATGEELGLVSDSLGFAAGHQIYEWDGALADSGPLPDGAYRLRFSVVDGAGNATSTTSEPIAIDTTPPSFSAFASTATSISPNGDGLFEDVTFSWSMSSDANMTVRIVNPAGKLLRVDQSSGQSYTWGGKSAQNLTVPSADYTIGFTCEDEAGNAAEQVVRPIKVKTTCLVGSPSVTPLVVRPGAAVQLVIPVHDESSVSATVSGEPIVLVKNAAADAFTGDFEAPIAPGNYPVFVEARDTLGNITTPGGTALIVRAAEVTGTVWLQDTLDDFAGSPVNKSAVDSVTIESRPGSVELSTVGWEQLADMPVARYGAQTCLGPDGKIYAIGGAYELSRGGNYIYRGVQNTSVFDPATEIWTERTAMPSARVEGRAVFAPDGKIYVLGGAWIDSRWGYVQEPTGTVECYDPATDTWERDTDHGGTLAPMPTARTVFGAAVGADGRIYTFGGYSGTMANGGSTDVVEVYDPVTNTWETKAPMPQKECCFATAGLDNKMYVFEGEYRSNAPTGVVETKLSAGWSYDTALDSWSSAKSSPVARTDALCSSGRDGRIYVYGGSTSTFSPVELTYGYSPTDDDWVRGGDMPVGVERSQGVSDVQGRAYALGGSLESYGVQTYATVQRYDPYYRPSGTFLSQVKDLYNPSSFGAIAWDADAPEGTELTVATRTSRDKVVWSPWSDEYLVSGSSVTNPVGRYIQYRITMQTADSLKSVRVDSVSIVYNAAPLAPMLYQQSFRTPTPVIAWGWVTDTESDPVTYDLQIDAVPTFDSEDLRDIREIDPEIVTAPGYQVPADTPLDDGMYFMRARSSDGRGQSEWSAVQPLFVDSTPPSVKIDRVSPSMVSVDEHGAVRSTVEYTVDETATVRLNVTRDSSYQIARQYLAYNVPPGAHVLELDGLTSEGQPLPSRGYTLELSATDALTNLSVVDRASLTVRRAPAFSTLIPSMDSADPQASCEAAITATGDATNASVRLGAGTRTLVDSDVDGTFTGRLLDAAEAGASYIDDVGLEDGVTGYRTPQTSGRLSVSGYVPGAAWREASQADFADGDAETVETSAGALTLGASKWRGPGLALLVQRSEAAAARIGSKVYVIGGGETGAEQTAEVHDIATGEKSFIAPPTSPRRSAVAVAGSDDRIYVFGGSGAAWTTGEVYDPATDVWQSFALPTPRVYSSAFTAPSGLIYLIGGFGNASVQALDPATMTWSTKSSPPSNVYNAGGCVSGDKYYLFGGFTGSYGSSALQIYDVPSDTWSAGPGLPGEWRSPQVQKCSDGLVYVFGQGLTWGGNPNAAQCWSFDPDTGEYAPREQPMSAAYGAVSASWDGTLYLIGGRVSWTPAPSESYDVIWRGSYVSSIYDAGRIAEWSTIGWTSFEPTGTSVGVQTRTSTDGESWSNWAGTYETGDQIVSPSGRFIQYRVKLASANAPWSPSFGDITIAFEGQQASSLTPPIPEYPSGAVFDAAPELAWTNSTGGISRRYEVQIDREPAFESSALRSFSGVPELTGTSVLYLPSSAPLSDGRWFWRVRATDGVQESDWSLATEFDVVTRPALAIESLQGPDTAEEGTDVELTAVVANHGPQTDGCVVRFVDSTSGEQIAIADAVYPGYEETAAVTVHYLTQDRPGTRTLTASIITPSDDDSADNTATTVLNVAPHGLSATVAPDRTTYTAEDTMTIAVTALNGGTIARDVLVSLRVVDAEGALVEELGAPTPLQLEAGQAATLTHEWRTRSVYPGDYSIQVDLVRDERTCFTSDAPFQIAEHVSLSGRVSVGRLQYSARDRVQVSSRVSNASANAAFSDLRVATEVLDSAGDTVASSEATVANLQRGEAKVYGLAWDIDDAEPGQYTATEKVTLADGSVIVTGSVGFEVLPSSQTGAGLLAALNAEPNFVHQSEACTLTYSLANDGNSDIDIPLTLSLVDPEASGTVLAEMSASAVVAKDGQAQGEFVIDTGSLPRVTSGGAQLLAILQGDVGGRRLTLDSASVQVLPVLATATLTSDASEYDALSSVTMTATISNETTGYALDGTHVELRITAPDGSLAHSESRTIATVDPDEPISERFAWATGLLAPGAYEASVSVTFDGIALSTASTPFVVLSAGQTGTGLSGQLSLNQSDLALGDTLTANYSLANDGNATVFALQGVVSLEDAATGEVLGQQPLTVNLPRGGNATGTATFATDDLLPTGDSRDLVVRLRTTVERGTLQLASATATVIRPQGVQIGVTKRIGSMPRVLVWTESSKNRFTANKALTEIGAYYTLVDSPAEFLTEMRSGLYDTLVILDTKHSLPNRFDDELVERVNSGATLIGTRWDHSDNRKRHDLFGIRFRGFLPDGYRRFNVPHSRCSSHREVEGTGRCQDVVAEGAQVIASWNNHPVVTAHDYGRGTAVLFAFDLACTDVDTGAGLLKDAVIGCPANEDTPDAEDVAVVEVSVENQGQATTVRVDETVANATVVGAIGAACYGNGSARWTRTVAQGETAVLKYLVRMDGQGRTALLTTNASSDSGGIPASVATAQLSIEPRFSDAELVANAIARLSAVPTPRRSDEQIKERTLKVLRRLQSDPPRGWGEHCWAIWQLVDACDDMARISASTTEARLAVDELMRLYSARWLR